MAKNKVPTRDTPPPAREPVRKVDLGVLSDERRKEIREKAIAKVAARAVLEAEEEQLRLDMDELERARHPEIVLEMREIRPNLALFADRVKLDGKDYFHGELYTVTKAVYDVIRECEQNTARHDAEIHGDPAHDFYQRERNLAVNMRTGLATRDGTPVRF